jgi:hypothetical protein
MDLKDIAIIVGLMSTGGTGLKFYADHTYVLVADSLQGQLFQLQRDIKRLELDDSLSDEDQAYLEFLRLQAEQLENELQ